MLRYYPNSNVPMLPGDVLYASIGRSTYYVGHTVIIGTDYLVKESIPGKPSGHVLTIDQMWGRQRKGDTITLLRAREGAYEAALWATEHVQFVKDYHLGNIKIQKIEQNYCSKFIVQAYYFGANIKLTRILNRFISPQYLTYGTKLDKIAIFKL